MTISDLLPDWIKKNNNKDLKNDKFIICYKKLKIGYLYSENKKYVFEYAEEFKKQDKIKPLSGFPDKHKIYRSEYIFPFFISRMPDPDRPLVKEIIDREEIEKDDLFGILDKFGKQTLDNPFVVTKM